MARKSISAANSVFNGCTTPVSLTRHGTNVANFLRARDYDNARAALKVARAWRDSMTRKLQPETKQEFSQRARPDNTSGCPGVYLKRQVVRRGDWSGEYAFWQAQTPQRGEAVSLTFVLG